MTNADINPVMHTGLRYGRIRDEGAPVPRRTYRCKSTAKEVAKLGHTHPCKLTIDHDGDHSCVCGKAWQPLDKVLAGAE